jgi:UDP-glucose 4-epimerase
MSTNRHDLSPDGTILVTGGAGYIGVQLVHDLLTDPLFAGCRVRILDNMQRGTHQAVMRLPTGTPRCHFIEGDILDPLTTRRSLEHVTAVVHLAALVKTPFSFEHPTWNEQINHWGTARLVESCLEAGVGRFICTSSASVYGPGGPFAETSPGRPVGPYAQSKWRAEQTILEAAPRGLHPTILRLATVFGIAPAMRFDTAPNRFGYLARVGRALPILGTGDQQRPMIHVRDASSAIRHCLLHPDRMQGDVFNVAGCHMSILELAELVQRVKPGTELRFTEQDVLTHWSLTIEDRKFAGTGWTAQESIEDALRAMIDMPSGDPR